MKFLIKVDKEKVHLTLAAKDWKEEQKIAADKQLSQTLLAAVDKMLKRAFKEGVFKKLPLFEVRCSSQASLLSCNIAKATAQALNFSEKSQGS